MPKPPAHTYDHGRITLGLMLALVGSGCGSDQTSEAVVDARPGIEQVGSAEGPLLDEDEACQRIRAQLEAARGREDCSDVVISECPGLIRPAGSLACVRFSEESVEACADQISAYDSCRDFVNDACIVVAVVEETSEGCVPPGPPPDAGADDDETTDAGSEDDDVADDDVADDDVADDDVEPDAGDDTDPPIDAGDDVADDDVVEAGTTEPDVDSGSGDEPDTGAPLIDSGSAVPDAGSDAAVSTDAAVSADAAVTVP